MTTRADRGRLSEVLWQALPGALFFGPTLEACDVLLFGEVWGWGEAVARSALFAVPMTVFSAVAVRFSATARERNSLRTVERLPGELPAAEGESAHVGDRPPSA